MVLTHFHDDHTAAAAEVVSWSGARVVAGAADAPFVRGDLPGPVPVLTEAEARLHAVVTAAPEDGAQGAPPLLPCRVDQEVADGDVLDVAGGARVVSVPGHTPCSTALHLPALGVLLTGGAVAEHQGQLVVGPSASTAAGPGPTSGASWLSAQRSRASGTASRCCSERPSGWPQ